MDTLSIDKIRILLCEDDITLGSLLADYLRRMDFEVDHCPNGEEGIEHFQKQHYDLCLLDINMPQMNGFEMLQTIRAMGSEVPVIILTERKANEDIIRSYELGCDEFLNKPCPMDILLCKIRAIMRRCMLHKKNTETEFNLGNGIMFDSVRQTLNGEHLSSRENDLLLILCRHLNETVDRNLILRKLWSQESYFASRSLCVYVNHLRKRLSGTNRRILGVHGKGYRLIDSTLQADSLEA